MIREKQALARLCTYIISETRVFSIVIPIFQMRKWRQREGKWLNSQSSKALQVITVSYSLPVIYFSLTPITAQCHLSWLLHQLPSPSDPCCPPKTVPMGPDLPGMNSALSLTPIAQWQNVILDQEMVLRRQLE